ncbi:Enoyl-CoA hydratase/isomerase [Rhodomicrobium vannielii ATCC 17100]|uniref:3-hydroxyisobutyryl-CoA hydrolase n=1 Tax=Rhodomicrobium vannielii (strain ATCC 17100 / DSM 162 / LMG 4299 / NCIMB 10020 / ATH 3.1.1) TaxID=648757 RepID=E3I3E7_RHOVT|nr:3-hydroxyisobutyryl-CoA hydrolase [Rhodomicrobium vannielii]ADP72595.1 Enoyl-CoA hydratase/isomerase [Rhodomicrobium vannielii ATCC 17100]
MSEEDVVIRKEGRAGRITLNRPAAMNALTWAMALRIEQALDKWEHDSGVDVVVVDAAGEKAFCAGGDIADLYKKGRAGDFDYGRKFWCDEYRLNAKIHRYAKPYVAFMDGIVMGGGVGVSAHGSHRIVTERSVVAMPETGIGLIPDVGGTFLLSRMPGRCGEYIAMTAARMGPGDAIYGGFADLYMPVERTAAAIAALCDTGDVTLLDAHCEVAPTSALAANRVEIDALFASPDAVSIVQSLENASSSLARDAAKAIRRNSPLAVTAALLAVRRARDLASIEDCLALEYRFTYRCQEMSDFLEGIRAAVIDKDRKPNWRFARLEDLDETRAEALLASLGTEELPHSPPERRHPEKPVQS